MTDSNKRLAIEGPKTLALRATVINGSIVVESEEDRERKKAERAKKRKSRWDNQGGSSSSSVPSPLSVSDCHGHAQLQIFSRTDRAGVRARERHSLPLCFTNSIYY